MSEEKCAVPSCQLHVETCCETCKKKICTDHVLGFILCGGCRVTSFVKREQWCYLCIDVALKALQDAQKSFAESK